MAGAEQLHFLACLGGGDAAADAVVVPPDRTHDIVVFILDRGCVDGDFGSIFLKCLWQAGRVKDGQFGSGDGPIFSSVCKKRKSFFVTTDARLVPDRQPPASPRPDLRRKVGCRMESGRILPCGISLSYGRLIPAPRLRSVFVLLNPG